CGLSCPNAFVGHPSSPLNGFPLKTCGNDIKNVLRECIFGFLSKKTTRAVKPQHEDTFGFLDFWESPMLGGENGSKNVGMADFRHSAWMWQGTANR
ncbi:MAG TPA: hypothetical protein VGA99_05735, partial [bacterium]